MHFQQTLSLLINSEFINSEFINSEFSLTKRLIRAFSINCANVHPVLRACVTRERKVSSVDTTIPQFTMATGK